MKHVTICATWLFVVFGGGAFALVPDFSIDFLRAGRDLQRCDLVFKRDVPPPKEVDALLRKALDLCLSRNRGTDVLAMGFQNDNALEQGRQYSGYLTFRRATNQIRTQAQEEGLKQSTRDGVGYAVILEERTRPEGIPGVRQYINANVVFNVAPSFDKAHAIATQEAARLSARKADIYVVAWSGDKSKRETWKPVPDRAGTQLSVKYDAKTKSIADGW
jgi:hypothetical protein